MGRLKNLRKKPVTSTDMRLIIFMTFVMECRCVKYKYKYVCINIIQCLMYFFFIVVLYFLSSWRNHIKVWHPNKCESSSDPQMDGLKEHTTFRTNRKI